MNKIKTQGMCKYVAKAYFGYAKYVIHDRALPFIGDGLKPVARRIIYAMHELGLDNEAKYKKSARTIGDVLGKFHPHGDTACYEAMVLMAQNFSYRYPLVDGQGNFGSIDEPKSFAAMRYTEAKLSVYAQALLEEINNEIIDWDENFDGSLKEPKYLPSRLPNVILNGSLGIAVGIATDIPSHNITECINALLTILDNKDATDDEIIDNILGPDAPTGGILITPREEIIKSYKTGSGNYKLRAEIINDNNNLVITSLPYQASSNKVIKQIADLIITKKVFDIEDIRDDSDEANPVRITLILKNKANIENILSILYSSTECEKNYKIQQYVLDLEHKPKLMSLPGILRDWLIFRKSIVKKRLESRLRILTERLHILEGLKLITLSIDEVIRIIRHEDHPKDILIQRFSLSEAQVKAILEIRLRQLSKVEFITLENEFNEKQNEKSSIEECLNNEKSFVKLLKKELEFDKKRFGNKRKTIINPIYDNNIKQNIVSIIPKEPNKIYLSKQYWLRATRNIQYDDQNLNYFNGDESFLSISGYLDQALLIICENGKSYSLPSHDLPSVRGKGQSVNYYVDLNGAKISQILLSYDNEKILLLSSNGYGFITKAENIKSRLKNGKNLMTLSENSFVKYALKIYDKTHIVIISSQGRLSIVALNDIVSLKKGKGNRIVALDKKNNDDIYILELINNNDAIVLQKNDQELYLDKKSWPKYITKGSKGILLPRHFRQHANLNIESSATNL